MYNSFVEPPDLSPHMESTLSISDAVSLITAYTLVFELKEFEKSKSILHTDKDNDKEKNPCSYSYENLTLFNTLKNVKLLYIYIYKMILFLSI